MFCSLACDFEIPISNYYVLYINIYSYLQQNHLVALFYYYWFKQNIYLLLMFKKEKQKKQKTVIYEIVNSTKTVFFVNHTPTPIPHPKIIKLICYKYYIFACIILIILHYELKLSKFYHYKVNLVQV